MKRLLLLVLLVVSPSAFAATIEINGTTTLRWVAPTQNVDGSPLTDLGGYRIHWGQQSRAYTATLDVTDSGATNWTFTVPLADETQVNWHFAMTAYDMNDPTPGYQPGDPTADPPIPGDNESAFSNEVLKTLTITINETLPPDLPQSLEVDMDLTCSTDDQFVTCDVTVN